MCFDRRQKKGEAFVEWHNRCRQEIERLQKKHLEWFADYFTRTAASVTPDELRRRFPQVYETYQEWGKRTGFSIGRDIPASS